jgi:hypothetical protein
MWAGSKTFGPNWYNKSQAGYKNQLVMKQKHCDKQCTQHFHLPRWLGACANYCELRKLLMRLVWSWFGFGFCNGRADEEVMKEAGMRATIAKETCSMQRVV